MYTTDNLGERLAALMQERKITQKKLADKCYIVQSNISHFRTGTAVPSVRTLCALSNALEVDINYFLKGD